MGMDLKPIYPSADAPRYPADDDLSPGQVIWGQYNWGGWSRQIDLLQQWGVDVSEFSGVNDGEVISEATCKAVADAIEQHLPELSPIEQTYFGRKIALWRTCGGYRQF